MPSITFDRLIKRFTAHQAVVDDLTFSVADGELLAIVGPTGSGKTTLLRLLAGLDRPTSGDIRIDGRSVLATPPWQRGISMAFQHPALIPQLMVRDQLTLNRKMGKQGASGSLAASEIERRVDQICKRLQISHLLNRRAEELSGGERQRVALASIFAEDSPMVMLDEPLSHLDLPQRLELRRLIRQLHRDTPRTMVYVTHDQSEALSLGQRIAVLNRGRLEQIASADEVYRQPATTFVASFIGNPPMNLFAGRLDFEGGEVKFSGPEGPLAVDNWPLDGVKQRVPRSVILGQRPETLRLEVESSAVQPSIGVRVVEVESQGDVVWIYVAPVCEVSAFGQPWIVKVTGDNGWRPGDRCRVTWDWTQTSWFDAATGGRLSN